MKILLVIALILVSFFFATRSKKTPTDTPSFSPIKALATVEEKEVRSLDGSKKLILTDEKDVYVSDEKGKRLLFSGSNLSLPPNAWAPDDAYVFIQENDSDSLHYLVFKTSGEVFTNGEQNVDVAPLFTKAQPNLRLKGITGWDGPDTLHVTTTTGPSFWFIVSSRAFLQLAR